MTFADFPFLRYLFFFVLGILLSNAIPEAQRRRLFDLARVLSDAA